MAGPFRALPNSGPFNGAFGFDPAEEEADNQTVHSPFDPRRRLPKEPRYSMMHELSLWGQVPADRHDIVLRCLSGLAEMKPQKVLRRHMVFKAVRRIPRPTDTAATGPMQALNARLRGDLYYVQLVGDVTNKDYSTNFENGSGEAKEDVKMKEENPRMPTDSTAKWASFSTMSYVPTSASTY